MNLKKIIPMEFAEKPKVGFPVKHQTPEYLIDLGLCLCHNCAKLHSTDYAFCNDCFTPISIQITMESKSEDSKIN